MVQIGDLMAEKFDNRPLGRVEATLCADYLHKKGKELPSGWITIWKKRPTEIAKDYKLSIEAILVASRRIPVPA